jgi:hypothetical protein
MMILDEKSIFSCRDSLLDDMSVKDYKTSIDIAFDFILKQKLIELSLTEFWCSLLEEYSEGGIQTVSISSAETSPISHNLPYEAGFSRYVATKTKSHTRPDVAPNRRIQLATVTSNFSDLLIEENGTIPHANKR